MHIFLCANCKTGIHDEDIACTNSAIECTACKHKKQNLSLVVSANINVHQDDDEKVRYHIPMSVVNGLFDMLSRKEGFNIGEKDVRNIYRNL